MEDSDLDLLKECERDLISMETEVKRGVEKRKAEVVEENEDDDDFITITRKTKKTLRRDSVNKDSTSDIIKSIEICITSLQELPKQMAMARILKSENIGGIIKIKYRSPFKIFITFSNEDDAEKLLKCKKFMELDYRCQKTYENNVSYGRVRGVDLGMSEKEIMDVLESEVKILSIKRLKRITEKGKWVDCESIRICFESRVAPKHVIAYGCRMAVEDFVFQVTQCSGCFKYGHIFKFCPSKQALCPKCGSSKHDNCTKTELKCLNCKGNHFVLDKERCPLFLKEKELRKIMSKENITYKRALQRLNEMNKPKDQYQKGILINEPQNETQNGSQSNITSSSAVRSFRDVLVSAEIHKEDDMDLSEDDVLEDALPIKEHIRKKNNKSKTKKNHQEKDDDASEETEKSGQPETVLEVERKFDLKRLIMKIRSIISEKETLEKKNLNVFIAIYEECKIYLSHTLSGASLFESIFGLLHNNYG